MSLHCLVRASRCPSQLLADIPRLSGLTAMALRWLGCSLLVPIALLVSLPALATRKLKTRIVEVGADSRVVRTERPFR